MKKKHKYKTYVFILENNQACNVSDDWPQEKLFALVDLKHTLWCNLALNEYFFILIVIDVIWDDLDLCFCVHDTWISGSHIWGTKFVEPIKLPEFECQSQLEYLSSSEMSLKIDAFEWFLSLSLSKTSFVTRRFPCWMSVIDDDSALLKIFRLELHMNIDLIEAAKKQTFCGRTKLDEHSLKSDIWFGVHDAIREIRENRFSLGNSPKQRTPPTHRYGLGLT